MLLKVDNLKTIDQINLKFVVFTLFLLTFYYSSTLFFIIFVPFFILYLMISQIRALFMDMKKKMRKRFLKVTRKTVPLTSFQKRILPNSIPYAFGLHIIGDLDEEKFFDSVKEALYFTNINTILVGEKSQIITNGIEEVVIKERDLTVASLKTMLREGCNKTPSEKAFKKVKEFIKSGEPHVPKCKINLLKYKRNHYYFVVICSGVFVDGDSVSVFLNTLSLFYNKPIVTSVILGLFKMFNYQNCRFDSIIKYQKYFNGWNSLIKQKNDLNYWIDKLRGSELRFDFKWPSFSSCNDGDDSKAKEERIKFEIGGETASKLIKLIKESKGKNHFNVCVSFFNAFLYRVFNSETIIMSYTVKTRPEGFNFMPGSFVNRILLKTVMNDKLTIKDLIHQTGVVRKEDLKHKDFVQYEELFDEIRKLDGTIKESTVNISASETIFSQPLQFGETETSSFMIHKFDSNKNNRRIYDLTPQLSFLFQICEERKRGYFAFQFVSTNTFKYEYMKRLITNFHIFIDEVLDNITVPISKQKILSKQEYYKQVVEFNQGGKFGRKKKKEHMPFKKKRSFSNLISGKSKSFPKSFESYRRKRDKRRSFKDNIGNVNRETLPQSLCNNYTSRKRSRTYEKLGNVYNNRDVKPISFNRDLIYK